ncbi:LacI family transcriptional regulator [Planctomycetales bacterium ZRK34]|nr:LacI family transcriptional regulator [Planctomycetales bacterium ZRK34]
MTDTKGPARLSDIAKAAGVSRVAVGRVLNGSGGDHVRVSEATREKILTIARRMNYRPNLMAQQLRGVRSQLFGVILDTVNAPVMYSRLSALEQEAGRRGYRLMIGQVHSDPTGIDAYLDDFESRGVEGVICLLDLMRGYRSSLDPSLAHRRNIVMHGQPLRPGGMCVRVDTADGVFQATGHLLDRQRSRVGMLLWNEEDALCDLRREGYQAACQSRGIEVDDELIYNADCQTADPTDDVIERAIDVLVDERGAEAIVAPNDVWAVRLIKRLGARGRRVPDEVAIVGYDNLDIAEAVEPELTSIDQQHTQYAAAALDLLCETAGGGQKSTSGRTVTIKPLLRVRRSS